MKQQNDAVGSLAISQLLVKIFLGVLVGVDVAAYWLVEWFLSWTRYRLVGDLPWQALFLLTIYAASIPAYFALYRLYRLLANLDKGQVFVEQNVTCLAVLSRCCWAVAAICRWVSRINPRRRSLPWSVSPPEPSERPRASSTPLRRIRASAALMVPSA